MAVDEPACTAFIIDGTIWTGVALMLLFPMGNA